MSEEMSASEAILGSADRKPPTILDLSDYLETIEMGGWVPDATTACEVCGSAETEPVREAVRVTDEIWARFVVVCCRSCGYLYQTPRFAPAFYLDYYARLWRLLLFGASKPTEDYVAGQIARGAALADSLGDRLPPRGRLLDVGCGAGGLMKPFLDRGWTGFGIDPDHDAIAYGANTLGLPVVAQAAEDLDVDAEAFDLIIITGSLEHVYDPNAVLRLCRRAAAPGSLLLLEGHALGQAETVGALGHNHRRFLTATSLELFMLKHGWTPELTTTRALCGPGREGSVFALGRRAEPLSRSALEAVIAAGRRETPDQLRRRLDASAVA
jgi:2-polyprenyl-3-methyl-5-hydroxy-6-metoxy-1,4-benzoquinol methylase